MALGSALVDRAVTLRNALDEDADRVEGTKVREVIQSEWFRCRLELPAETEATQSGRARKQRGPNILVAKRDLGGELVDILSSDLLGIVSAQLGSDTWRVQGAPKPLRRRRAVIGWEVALSKVEE